MKWPSNGALNYALHKQMFEYIDLFFFFKYAEKKQCIAMQNESASSQSCLTLFEIVFDKV